MLLNFCKNKEVRGVILYILEAFSVDDGRTRLVILFFGDPHLLEGGKRSKDGATDPHRVFSLRGSNDFDFHY